MKSAAFDYIEARSTEHALALLAEHGEDARAIAGGQSLLPAMNLRMSAPAMLVGIAHLSDLRGITALSGGLRIGAMTRHAEILASPLVGQQCPMILEAMRHVAHPAIRNRGTIGGNLAHADPASELPACMVALGATLVLRGQDGERRVSAGDFFTGLYETALAPGELLVAVEIPALNAGERTGFLELARRHGDYALAGLAAHVTFAGGAIKAAKMSAGVARSVSTI